MFWCFDFYLVLPTPDKVNVNTVHSNTAVKEVSVASVASVSTQQDSRTLQGSRGAAEGMMKIAFILLAS